MEILGTLHYWLLWLVFCNSQDFFYLLHRTNCMFWLFTFRDRATASADPFRSSGSLFIQLGPQRAVDCIQKDGRMKTDTPKGCSLFFFAERKGQFSVCCDTRLFFGVTFLMLVLTCPTGLSSDPMHCIQVDKDPDQPFFFHRCLVPLSASCTSHSS